MSKRRVVVTGMGAVTPVGIGMDNFWSALINGKSGVSLIESIDTEKHTVKIAAEIKDKDFYFLVTAAEDEEGTADTTLNCLRGFMDCCEGSVEKGAVLGLGVYELGEIEQKGERFLQQAYEMGKAI